MKRFLVFFGVLTIAFSALAADFGIEAGFRQQSGTVTTTGISTKSEVGYSFGVSTFLPMQDRFGLRTGLAYTQRPLTIEVDSPATGSGKANLTYFDVPVLLALKFEDYASVFAGPVVSLRLEESFSGSGALASQKIQNAKSMVIPIQFGASFKFAPQLGATVFYETIPGDVADDIGSYRAVGANIVFTYD